jgi:hypothetical protein
LTTTLRAWARAAAGEAAASRASGRGAAEEVTQPPYRKIIVQAKLLATIIHYDVELAVLM